MACNVVTNNFARPLSGSFAMKDNTLFGCYAAEGKLIHGGDDVDDALGELREEEIVWGEAEMHHQHKDLAHGGERVHGKVGTRIKHGDRRAIRHCSILSREMEMQASTWAPGSKICTVLVATQSGKGDAHMKAVPPDRMDREGEVGGCEEEKQHMDELIPPHELLARQYAANATTSFSVLHGAGRTLKGMDLRRLRNEVWRQTGFVD